MLDLKHGCLGDGEHLPADQSLPVAHQQDLGKQLGHFLTHVADEGGERGEVRLGIAGDRHEQHVVATCPLYGARTDDATAVGEQHNLEQYRRGEGRRAAGVVAEASFQRRQIEFPIHQIAQGVLEAAGQNLLGEIDGDEFRRVIDGLEAGHGVILGKDDALYHGHVGACGKWRVFLQPQRRSEGRLEREARRVPASAACRPSLSTAGLARRFKQAPHAQPRGDSWRCE